LAPADGVDDIIVFEKFGDECLTVKPHPVSSRRTGKPTEGRPQKLRITLESSQSVDDLIESSSMLHNSQINAVKRVYINRDQTTIERQAAFDLRKQRRDAVLNSGGSTSLKTTVQPLWQ